MKKVDLEFLPEKLRERLIEKGINPYEELIKGKILP